MSMLTGSSGLDDTMETLVTWCHKESSTIRLSSISSFSWSSQFHEVDI